MVIPENSKNTIPIHAIGSDSATGNRLGGFAPVGVQPGSPDKEYVLTLTVDGTTEMSLFVKYDDRIFMDSVRVVDESYDLVEIVFHPPLPRGSGDGLRSRMSGHKIVLDPEQLDEQEDEEDEEVEEELKDLECQYSMSKLGGAPFLLSLSKHRVEAFSRAAQDGYRHFAQIELGSIADRDVKIENMVPLLFGRAVTHIYLKHTEEGYRWRCIWG